jgi:uncharacterized NAD(P)/FAD-binding protein YdhS
VSALSTPVSVAVIGAGFSGTAVALQLLRRLRYGDRLLLLEQGARFGRGLAYGTRSGSHWLNVPAGRLGWDPDDEGGFVRWLQQRDSGFGPADFVPRMMLGDYLAASLQEACEHARSRGVTVLRLQAAVVDGQRQAQGIRLRLADGAEVLAHQVVLATGHVQLALPPLTGARWGEPGLVGNPWAADALADLPEDGDVLVLGSGLTAVDMVTWLQDRGHAGRVWLMSRRGLLPQAHRTLEARPQVGLSPVHELGTGWRLRDLVRALRGWASQAQAEGRDWRDVMASLRSCTPALWQALSEDDRRRFLRHLTPWWDTHRHRLAPGIHRRLSAAITAGQVEVAAGRVQRIEPAARGGWQVFWQARGDTALRRREVAAVLNCTGATTGLARTQVPLLAAWRDQGWLCADALDLGLRVDAQHRPLARDGQAQGGLYYVGPMLKAQHWEAIAIPELRRHAAEVAQVVAESITRPALAAP